MGALEIVTLMLAIGVTVVVAVAELFAALGSLTEEVAVAVFDTEAAADAVARATIATITELPLLMVPRLQLTVVVPVHVPAVVAAETNVSPAGNVSVRFTAVAADGPALDTRIW